MTSRYLFPSNHWELYLQSELLTASLCKLLNSQSRPGSISGTGKGFVFTLWRPDRLWTYTASHPKGLRDFSSEVKPPECEADSSPQSNTWVVMVWYLIWVEGCYFYAYEYRVLVALVVLNCSVWRAFVSDKVSRAEDEKGEKGREVIGNYYTET
jgi:hypothetical protein